MPSLRAWRKKVSQYWTQASSPLPRSPTSALRETCRCRVSHEAAHPRRARSLSDDPRMPRRPSHPYPTLKRIRPRRYRSARKRPGPSRSAQRRRRSYQHRRRRRSPTASCPTGIFGLGTFCRMFFPRIRPAQPHEMESLAGMELGMDPISCLVVEILAIAFLILA